MHMSLRASSRSESPKVTAKTDERPRILLLALGATPIVLALGLIAWGDGGGTSHVVTTGAPPDTTVTTFPGHAARSGDTLEIFLLGIGLALVLAGALYHRISKIGLPGGCEIDLTPTATAQLADQVKKQVGDDPRTFDRAYRKALSSLGSEYWGKLATPPPERLKSAAVAAKGAIDADDLVG
jgi:hypothetical protein